MLLLLAKPLVAGSLLALAPLFGCAAPSPPANGTITPTQTRDVAPDGSTGKLGSSFSGLLSPWSDANSSVVNVGTGVNWGPGSFGGGFNAKAGDSTTSGAAVGGGWSANSTHLVVGAGAQAFGVDLGINLVYQQGEARIEILSPADIDQTCTSVNVDPPGEHKAKCVFRVRAR